MKTINIQNTDKFTEIFSHRLKRLRIDKELTFGELSEALTNNYNISASQPTLCNYERGSRFPTLYALSCIADYYEVTVDYILGKTDNKQAKVIESSFVDENNTNRNVKIEVLKDSDLAKMTIEEAKELVSKLSKVGFNVNKLIDTDN